MTFPIPSIPCSKTAVRRLRVPLALLASAVAFALVFPILALGLLVRLIDWAVLRIARLSRPRAVPWKQLLGFDQALGWKPRLSGPVYHEAAGEVFYSETDADGWRSTRTIGESEIVVFGDSFAWGYGIDEEDYFANQIPEIRVKAIGLNGYNMVQELLLMRRLKPQLREKTVVWFVYHGNDLYENLSPHMWGYRMPFVREASDETDWEVVNRHIRPARWPCSLDGRVYYETLAQLGAPTFFAQRAYAAAEMLIRSGRDVCHDAGARLVVVTIPDRAQLTADGIASLRSLARGADFDPQYPDRRIAEICTRLRVPFVALANHVDASDYKTNDAHWNRKGHRRVASVLCDLHRAHAPERSHPSTRRPALGAA